MSKRDKKPKRKGYQPIDKERKAARERIRQQYLDNGKSPAWIRNVIGEN